MRETHIHIAYTIYIYIYIYITYTHKDSRQMNLKHRPATAIFARTTFFPDLDRTTAKVN